MTAPLLALLAGCAAAPAGEPHADGLPAASLLPVLNRVSWGASTSTWRAAKAQGIDRYLDRQLHPGPDDGRRNGGREPQRDQCERFRARGGPEWHKTVVVVASEFGRTFRENGNRGTDHGHGTVFWVLDAAQLGRVFPGARPKDLGLA